MKDIDIRRSLRITLRAKHGHDPSTHIVEEFGVLLGKSRIDMAVVNGALVGYEIKSDRDTLDRLPSQIEHYFQVFDFVNIVTGPRHLAKVKSSVPDLCGIQLAEFDGSGNIKLSTIRQGKKNYNTSSQALVRLLWKEEWIKILKNTGECKSLSKSPIRQIWRLVEDLFTPDEISNHVRYSLKERLKWQTSHI